MSLSQYAQHGIAALGDDSVMPHSSNVYGMGRQYMPRSSNDLINHCARQHPNPSGAWSDRGGGGHEHRQPRPSIQEPFRYPYTTYGHSAHAASLPNLPSHPTQERPSTRRLPRLSDATSQWSPPSQLYTIADPESIGGSSSSVKVEPDDDGFIQDLTHQSSSPPPPFEHLVPPTEVPLRATQASKEMRKLMGVFRLNPFSMHHGGGRGVSAPLWNGEDAGPLEEPPSFIEYQLEGVQIEVDVDFEDGSSELSPGFDADMGCDGATTAASNSWTGSGEGVRSSWQAANWGAPGVFSSPSGTSASLELDYPDSLASQLPATYPFRNAQNYFTPETKSQHSESDYNNSSSISTSPAYSYSDSSPCNSPVEFTPRHNSQHDGTSFAADDTSSSSVQSPAAHWPAPSPSGYAADYARGTGRTMYTADSHSAGPTGYHAAATSAHTHANMSATVVAPSVSRSGGAGAGGADPHFSPRRWSLPQATHAQAYIF